ncbi:SEC14 domain and spectrin repeat-containing protein 1-like isoform X4 [Dysidea avara]|uniref:SEC14 domain and spectrin repeat-containing protein 1-like isoform X4 n=1 Tax=Dysidea avara TaxID=196820 RepID=UPI00332AA80A
MAFHWHLEKWRQDYEFCQEEGMKEGMPFDDTMATQDQQQMDNLKESGGQVIQEGRGLLEMMHQQSELQMPHPPEYKKGSRHVRHCSDEIEDKKNRVEQLAETRKVRQDQLKQIYTCEKDAKQVLDDLGEFTGAIVIMSR